MLLLLFCVLAIQKWKLWKRKHLKHCFLLFVFINHFVSTASHFRERESLKMHHNIDQYLLKLLIQIYDGSKNRKKKKNTDYEPLKKEKEITKEIIRSGAIIPSNRKRCLCRLLSYIIITIIVWKLQSFKWHWQPVV